MVRESTVVAPTDSRPTAIVESRNFSLWYGNHQALRGISFGIPEKRVTAIIGPSGCGKSTFLKSINRMVDFVPNVRTQGEVIVDGQNVFDPEVNPVTLRSEVGLIFQKPNPFPKSIFDNVAFGPRLRGIRDKRVLTELVEKSLRQAALWDEVKDRLHTSAFSLSGGQQQRLCIARALVVQPRVLLMDEPASALDPVSTAKVEELIQQLKADYTIVIVTHNMQQAARISDYTAFMLSGELIEFGDTKALFTQPRDPRTEDYITGRFG